MILNKKRKNMAEKDKAKMTQVNSYAKLTGIENIPLIRVKCMLGAWNNFFLPGKICTFLFKFYNNSLGLNNRVAKFNNTVLIYFTLICAGAEQGENRSESRE